jgi:hypothetical protein
MTTKYTKIECSSCDKVFGYCHPEGDMKDALDWVCPNCAEEKGLIWWWPRFDEKPLHQHGLGVPQNHCISVRLLNWRIIPSSLSISIRLTSSDVMGTCDLMTALHTGHDSIVSFVPRQEQDHLQLSQSSSMIVGHISLLSNGSMRLSGDSLIFQAIWGLRLY